MHGTARDSLRSVHMLSEDRLNSDVSAPPTAGAPLHICHALRPARPEGGPLASAVSSATFSSNVSHGLSAPLTAVSTFQSNEAQLAPLTACDPSHFAQTVSTVGHPLHFAQVGPAAQLNDSVAPHTDVVSCQNAVATLTIDHVSPRTASSNEGTPTYLSDLDSPK